MTATLYSRATPLSNRTADMNSGCRSVPESYSLVRNNVIRTWQCGQLLCWLLLAASAHPQTLTAPLDLKSSLALADSSNLELRAARQQRALALAGVKIAGQIPNPTVSFFAARDTPHEGFLWDQPIEVGGKRGKRIAVAREEQRATEIDIGVVERQVRHRTRDAFHRAVLARAQTEQSKAALDLSIRIRDTVRQRYDAGDVAELEVIQSEVEAARSAADYEAATQSQKIADVQLAVLLNRSIGGTLELQGRVEDLPHSQELTVLTAQSLRSNTEIQRAAQELAIEERRLILARSQRIPNVDLQAGVDFNSPPDFDIGPRGQIAVAVPLFNRGQGEIAQSNARTDFLRLSLQAQKNNAESQVYAAYFDYLAKSRQAQQYSGTIVPQTQRMEAMAEESYRAGKSNLLTLIDSQRRLNETRKTYLDSLFAVQSAFSALEEVVGAPLD
jgi:outer membrane protein, heavy metal efflux system